MELIFFDNWQAVWRTGILAVLAYTSLVVLLRISGRRTLSKMNAFDLVVTVALGSTLASVILSKNVTLSQGVAAFALLIGMQFIVTWTSVRVPWVRHVVTGEPALLFYQGQHLPAALKRARVTEDEIRAAVRSNGMASLDKVHAVVLETDGSFSVVPQGTVDAASSLSGVVRPGPYDRPGQEQDRPGRE
ncbi:DUF421 domain-containing protein [Halomonas sp. McH1-25]|uniref:DUF421 domain-containing protein n=1 Tax=unclassified Halomonas TaxID=2609666 RepID=UPI001EF71ABF|nr:MULTISPECIES: YetF domain-containing protein [unclassified Halomonas]MCG7598776.1 DUF421 domain-containing protein [Halomonas sp. McH1-25]MCP1340739.1 DUF421 domain-containing protein [Halomonas sp. FL8]MCP1359510.1 DUF421 domain-containing protein [Halomonas sp. BBD45]MCP1367294.1 DUF421 domain-containing protein [Halomonas sp. BBD48]